VAAAHSLDPWGIIAAKGIPYMRQAVVLQERILTNREDFMALAMLKSDLSVVETNEGQRELLIHEALALHRQYLPPDDLQIAQDLFSLGQLQLDRDKLEEAETTMRETVELHAKLYDKNHPRMPIVRRFLIEALVRRGKWDEAEKLVRDQFQDLSVVPEYWIMLVRLKAARGDWPGAIEEAQRAREAKIVAIDYEILLNLAGALLQAGRQQEYRQACHEVLERAPSADTRGKSVAAEIALLLPVSDADFNRACELADTVVSTNDASLSYGVLAEVAKALAERRRGQFDSATNWAGRTTADAAASDCSCSDAVSAQAWFIQAAALARLQQMEAARAALTRGDKVLRRPHTDFVAGYWGGGWGEWAIAEYLGREAHAIIETQPATGR
jgi:tetratricopeptide (TPR) repeat protein